MVAKLDCLGRDMRETMETAWSSQDLGAKILSGPLAGVYDPRGMGKIFFAMSGPSPAAPLYNAFKAHDADQASAA